MTILSSFLRVPILKAICTVERKGSGYSETSLECRNCRVHELGLYGMLE